MGGERAFRLSGAHVRALGQECARLRDGGLARNSNRYVAWLQYAAALGNGPASYELAVYYRRQDQPALAAPYEARAEDLGFQAPVSLDHIRK